MKNFQVIELEGLLNLPDGYFVWLRGKAVCGPRMVKGRKDHMLVEALMNELGRASPSG